MKSLSFSFGAENRQDAEIERKWGNYSETHVHVDSLFALVLSRLSQEREPCFRATADSCNAHAHCLRSILLCCWYLYARSLLSSISFPLLHENRKGLFCCFSTQKFPAVTIVRRISKIFCLKKIQKAWSEIRQKEKENFPGGPPLKTLSRMIVLKFPAARERRSRSHKKYENTYSVKDKFKVKRKVWRIAREKCEAKKKL